MPSVTDALNSKPPLGAQLAEGVRTLSANQVIAFSLYRRYVFPLDGMVYWIKVPSSSAPVQTPGIQVMPGLATETRQAGEAIQVSIGGPLASKIVGGVIINPVDATESLFVDFTGPAYSYVTATTSELEPGDSIEIPANCMTGAWVCAESAGHKFTCIMQQSISSVLLPTDVEVMGSFHFTSRTDQREDATVTINEVIFTSLSNIQSFNQIGPDYLYVGKYAGITFAFSSRGRLYEQADLYHYRGRALFSTRSSQIIDDPNDFNPTLVVSNSLPIWLYMPIYVPPYPGFTCTIPLFPSYLVTDNLPPPFGSVHIDTTNAIEMSPYLGPQLQSSQVCRDKVKIHLYGLDNAGAITFLNFIEQYSRDWNYIGFASSPAVRDEKTEQSEFNILAQHKTIEMEINYQQAVSREMTRQLILHARVQFYDPHWIVDAA